MSGVPPDAPGFSDRNRFIGWSMNKTVTAVLVADGRLRLADPAPLPEWHRPGDPRAAITLRHLLTMSSGLRHTELGEPIEASDNNQVLFVTGTAHMAADAIAQPPAARPGAKWEYGSLTSLILAEIVTRTLTPSRDPRGIGRVHAAIGGIVAGQIRPAALASPALPYPPCRPGECVGPIR